MTLRDSDALIGTVGLTPEIDAETAELGLRQYSRSNRCLIDRCRSCNRARRAVSHVVDRSPEGLKHRNLFLCKSIIPVTSLP